ncbi:MAG: rhomboid family intramembrane serine protease [Chloroflexi bacterium]|nr:rhomboid family intramembrane serine protease [Chloroflexota bacterium]
MIPLRDLNPTRSTPYVTVALILANVLVFAYQILIPARQLNQFVLAFALQPYELTHNIELSPAIGIPVALTMFTSMFMHGGWLHIIGNMLYLWIFGNNVEDRLGHLFFLIIYLGWGAVAALTQVAVDPNSRVPMLGASGAIAGVLGAYLVMYPAARVETLVTLGFFLTTYRLPAWIVIGVWIIVQFFNGLVALDGGAGDGVAYFAHIGGAVAGLFVGVLVRLLSGRSRPVDPYGGRGGLA